MEQEYCCDYCHKPLPLDAEGRDLESVFWWDEADNHLACLPCAKELNLTPGDHSGHREKF